MKKILSAVLSVLLLLNLMPGILIANASSDNLFTAYVWDTDGVTLKEDKWKKATANLTAVTKESDDVVKLSVTTFNGGRQWLQHKGTAVEPGKSYLIYGELKTSISKVLVQFDGGPGNNSTNTLAPPTAEHNDLQLVGADWTPVYAIMSYGELTDEGRSNKGAAITLKGQNKASDGGANGDVYLRNYKCIELPAIASSTPANGATGVATDAAVSVTLSKQVQGLTASNFTINNGASVTNAATTDGLTYTLTLSGVTNGQTYTISASAPNTLTNTSISCGSFSFTTAAAATQQPVTPPAPPTTGNLFTAYVWDTDGVTLKEDKWKKATTNLTAVTKESDDVVKLSVTTFNGGRQWLQHKGTELQPGKSYLIYGELKTSISKVLVQFDGGPGNNSTNTLAPPTAEHNDLQLVGADWTPVYAIMSYGELTDEGRSNKGAAITLKGQNKESDSGANGDVYLRNYKCIELPTIASSTPANGATNVATDTTVSVTFNTELQGLTASNFTVSGATVTNATTTDGYTYILTVSGLAGGTEYTVSATALNALTNTALSCGGAFSFTTAADSQNPGTQEPDDTPQQPTATAGFGENILKDYDFSFESATLGGNGTTNNFVDASGTQNAVVINTDASHGTQSLKTSSRSTNNAARQFKNAEIPVSAELNGKKVYRLSIDMKLAIPETTATAYIRTSVSSNNESMIKDGWTGTVNNFTISGDKWTTVWADFTATTTQLDKSGHSVHLQYALTGTNNKADVIVDNYSIRELDTTVLGVDTSPANGATGIPIDTSMTVIFNTAIPDGGFTTSNVAIDNAASIKSVTPVNDFGCEYLITFENLRKGATYNVTLSNITSSSGKTIDSKTVSFSTPEKEVLTDILDGKNGGFEGSAMSPWGNAGICNASNASNSGGNHWVVTDADSHANSGHSLYNYGCGCGGHGTIQNIALEENTDYILSFWAKINGSASIHARANDLTNTSYPELGNKNMPDLASLTFEGTGEWKQYYLKFNSTYVDSSTGKSYINKRLYLRLASPGVPVYYDDFILYKYPGEMSAAYTDPTGNAADVETSAVKIGFSNDVNTYLNLTNPSNYVTIDNGLAISSLSIDPTDSTMLVATLDGVLDANTKYTVSIKDKAITDIFGQAAPAREISFTTEPIIRFERNLTFTAASGADVKITNRSRSAISRPVVMYVVYNADGTLADVKSSTFDGTLPFNTSADITELKGTVALASGQTATAYLFTSADNIALLAQPIGTGTIETGSKVASEPATLNVATDTTAGSVTISGTAEAGSTVTVMLLKSDDTKNSANVDNYNNNNMREIAMTDLLGTALSATNISTYAKHIAHDVAADSTGNWQIVLPVALESSEKVYGLVVSGDGVRNTDTATAVYMPSTTVYDTAKSAINSATTKEQMKTALDTYGEALGMDTASVIYGTDGNEIAQALLAKKPAAGFADFTSGAAGSAVALFNEISAYYVRQRDALAILNADTTTSEMITSTLGTYSDVLGYYEEATKLNYQAKYSQYTENAVNQILIASRPYASMNDFITKFNGIVITSPNYNNSPGGSSSGSTGSGFSAVTPGGNYISPAEKPMFTDIADIEWAREAIEILGSRGIINGVGDGLFMPYNNVTREEFVKMAVLSFEFIPDNSGESFFADVPSDAWYAPYVNSAYKNGMITGISETEFGTGQPITRQDLITMLYRIMERLGQMPEKSVDISFADASQISSYAADAVHTLASSGIINGVSEGVFAPKQNATRAQVAVILNRLFDTYIDVYF